MGSGLLGLWNELGSKMGIPGTEERAREKMDFAEKMFTLAGIQDGALSKIADAAVAGLEGQPNQYAIRLNEVMAQLARDAADRAVDQLPIGKKPLNPTIGPVKSAFAAGSTVDALTRIGAIVRPGGGSLDPAKETAISARQMVRALDRHTRLLEKITQLTGPIQHA